MEEYTQLIGDKRFTVVQEIGEYDYSWSIGMVLRDDDGNLFWVADSGCSCTYFGENLTVADLTPLAHLSDAVGLASQCDWFSDWEITEFAEKLMA